MAEQEILNKEGGQEQGWFREGMEKLVIVLNCKDLFLAK